MSKKSIAKRRTKKSKSHFWVFKYDDSSVAVIKNKRTVKQFATLSDAKNLLQSLKTHNCHFGVGLDKFASKRNSKETNKILNDPLLLANNDLRSQNLIDFISAYSPLFFGALSGSISRMTYLKHVTLNCFH